MAIWKNAKWMPLPWGSGSYVTGPYKIVHHTTEGSTAAGAFATYDKDHWIPHFTVDADTIYQHLDTEVSATALEHHAGTVETNRSSAIQYELVGFAGRPKNLGALKNAGLLCRWLESIHGIPQIWPSGYPDPPLDGNDPGHHNRSVENWTTRGGHYGHCHVPNNIHWDPAYTKEETDYLMSVNATAPFIAEAVLEVSDHSILAQLPPEQAEIAKAAFDANGVFGPLLDQLFKQTSAQGAQFGGFFPKGINYVELSGSLSTGMKLIVSCNVPGPTSS